MKRTARIRLLALLGASLAPWGVPAAEDGRQLTLEEALAMALKETPEPR